MLRIATASLVLLLYCSKPGLAKVIFVDNRIGDELNDGSAPTITGLRTGPVRSFTRARLLMGPGDIIEIANTGTPYYDSLRLVGGRASGVPSQPVTINGNGATFDGSDPVDPFAWQSLGEGLWRLDPLRKGYYRLVRDTDDVPEVPATGDALPALPPGHWAAWKGSIYYQILPDEIPSLEPFRIASREAGIFLYGVHNVVVRDLRLRYYHLDGVNVHDQVYDAAIQNVVAEDNGRAGIFVGGSSQIIIRGGEASGNREASVLLREKAKANLQDVKLDAEPLVAE